jgi:hypothetical protein
MESLPLSQPLSEQVSKEHSGNIQATFKEHSGLAYPER